jgi:polyhydroxyalkanoate synthesis regulator phasin
LRSASGPRAIWWLTPIAGVLLVVGVWLSVKDYPDIQADREPRVLAQEPGPTASADKSVRSDRPPLPESRGHEPWDEPTREELASQLERFFGDPREGKSKVPFTAEELADESLQMRLFDLNQQVTAAADYGVDLRNLEGYGIVLNANGTVSINNNVYQRWMGVESVLRTLEKPYWRESDHREALRAKGLSEDIINGIEERASRETLAGTLAALRRIYQNFVTDVTSGSMSPEAARRRVDQLVYEMDKNTTEPQIRRAIEILKPLSTAQKEAVVSTARKGFSSHTTIFPRNRYEAAEVTIAAAKSGELMRTLDVLQQPVEGKP